MKAKQSTAKSFLIGPILDSDGVAKTDEVVGSIKVTKNGTVGAPHGSSTLTHNHTGHYVYAANAGDVDTLGIATFSLNSTTNAMAPVSFEVVTANVYDSLVGGTDRLDVEVGQMADDVITEAAFAANSIAAAAVAADVATEIAAAVTSAGGLSAAQDAKLTAIHQVSQSGA
jgi:hypothetical protein